ncbi:MAG TPA: hypothetical protein VEA38_14395 [Terriglobales bacterium]|nr:hypothetical protein [Terriglobales bacterium]
MAYWRCACGAQNSASNPKCEFCGAAAVAVTQTSSSEWNGDLCARCGTSSKSTSPFHDDGHPDDRGVRLCGGCWIPALRRRAGHATLDAKGPDGRTVREYIAEIQVFIAGYASGEIQSRMRHWPTILERRGFHPPRIGVDMTIPETLGWDDPASRYLRDRMDSRAVTPVEGA